MTIFSNQIPITKDGITYGEQANFINKLAVSIYWLSPILNPAFGQVEPPDYYKFDGALAFADGTNWNPNGTGKGWYYYNTTTLLWVKL